MSEYVPTRYRTTVLGTLQAGWSVGYIVATLLAGWILPSHGWRWLFYIAIIPVTLAVVMQRFVPEPQAWINAQAERARKTFAAVQNPSPPKRESMFKLIFGDAQASRMFIFWALTAGFLQSGADLINALATYDHVTRQVGRFLSKYDLLLTPTSAILPEVTGTYDPARPGIDVNGIFADLEPKETFTALFNGTGHPAISLPTGRSVGGLPIGSQLVAPFGREDLLLAVARQLEESLVQGEGVWGQGRPVVHAGNFRQ